MSPRLAQPAQVVVALTGITQRERLALDAEFIGVARSGERFAFVPDDSIELAPTELRLGGRPDPGASAESVHAVRGADGWHPASDA